MVAIIVVALVLLACPMGPAHAAEPTRLLRYPDVSATQVVFSYAGDLWIASRDGGAARRLTSHPGEEVFAKFSPDGTKIAFTAEYDGNEDVYVIPAAGGEPQRLTYHPGPDNVLGWNPAGDKVLFRSARVSAPPGYTRLFLASLDGGLPQMLPLPRASLSSFSPDGESLAYNPTSREFRHWKRYRGGWTSYIGIFSLTDESYRELPRSGANDMFPMWHGDGIYFISDRDGVMNLYRYDLGTSETRKLTDFTEYDVTWPSLGPDEIVFENGGLLYRLDLATEKILDTPVTVAAELLAARPELVPVADLINGADIAPGAERAVVEARGDLFTLPAEHGSPRALTSSSAVHDRDPVWSPDGKWIAYFSDATGEYQLYLRPQKGGDAVQVTDDLRGYPDGLIWSTDSTKLGFTDNELRLWYVDIEERKPVLMDHGAYRGVEISSWAPDSRWLAYVKVTASRNPVICLYSLDQGKTFQVTDGFYNDRSPVFDPDGSYLYLLSDRYLYPAGDRLDWHFGYYDTTGVFALTLARDHASPFALRSDEEKAEEGASGDDDVKPDEKTGKKGAEKTKDGKEPAEPKGEKGNGAKPVHIDIEGLGQRIAAFPIPAGIYADLDARSGKVYYMSASFETLENGRPGSGPPEGTLHVFDLESREDATLMGGISGYALDRKGDKLLYEAGSKLGIVDATPGKAKVGEGLLATASLQARVDPPAEWRQILHEAWRIERDFYWDPNMRGLDWRAVGARYEALLPWVAHRSDLNYVIGEMIGELSTSHTYVGGGKVPPTRKVSVGMLGVDFAADGGFWRFATVYEGRNWQPDARSPLTEPGLGVHEGDYLIAVNGRRVPSTDNPYAHFQGLASDTVELTVNSQPTAEGARTILVEPLADETDLRYVAWVEANRRKVAEATGGRVGYMHVPDTAVHGLQEFDRALSGQLDAKAMIVDERYNRGGWLPSFYTEKLRRQLLAMAAPRGAGDTPWPPVAIAGPKVMLINERAGSGGDAFPFFFKKQGIGPLIGVRTWGGLVGISRRIPLQDGGTVTAPEVGFWDPDTAEWVAENHGIEPDIEVRQRPDLVVKGQDPQLEKAIEVVLEQLEEVPPLPERPPYPPR